MFVLAIVCAVYWVIVAFAALRIVRSVPVLAELPVIERTQWPRVSVIIPACNEEATLEAALRSRLAERYPKIEYLVVNDRSTDRTGEIIDRIAAEDARVVPIHIAELPDGWLGKLHAMHVALGHATGEWIMLSDADVHHAPDTLCRVIAHAEHDAIDHVTVFPSVWWSKFGLDAAMTTLLRILTVCSRAWKVSDPRSRVSLGGGNFNLVRRRALDRIGGFVPLRLEVLDDIALGQRLKWSGARACVLNARGYVGLSFYSSLGEVVGGMEKNGFAAVGGFSVVRCLVALGAIALCELGAFVALAVDPSWLAAATVGAAVAIQLAIARWLGRPAVSALPVPFGVVVFGFGVLRSMVLTLWRGGIAWRGTRYPLAALRRGRCYKYA
ncbi:MAG TPA: glycosyltransferase family 2 protein [Kofleriaceae bacterium]